MHHGGGLLCVYSKGVPGNLSVDDAARRLKSCRTVARLDRVTEDAGGPYGCLEDVDPSFTSLDCFEFHQRYDVLDGEPAPKTSTERCNRKSFVIPHSSYGDEKVGDRRSLKYKCRDLSNCTEVLGAESVPWSADAELDEAPEIRQEARLSEISEVNISRKTIPVRVEETSSSTKEFSDFARESPRCRRSTLGHPRTLPPPLSSLQSNCSLLKSSKSNGRFVLQRVAIPARSSFQAIRRDGHLKLELVSPTPAHGSAALFSNEEGEKDIAKSEGHMAAQNNLSLRKDYTKLFMPRSLRGFHPEPSCERRGVALKPGTEPFLYDFHQESHNLTVSEEEVQLLSTCKELSADWQQPLVGPQRAGLQSNVGDQLICSEGRPHRRGNQSIAMEAQHGFAIFNFGPFRLNLLFLHFQRCKGGFKIDGVYCFKDSELEHEKGGAIESVLDNQFNDTETTKEELFSFQMRERRNQWMEERAGFESAKGIDFFTDAKVGDHNTKHPTSPKCGIGFFSRFFQSQLALFVSM